jgi:hypothetical protein
VAFGKDCVFEDHIFKFSFFLMSTYFSQLVKLIVIFLLVFFLVAPDALDRLYTLLSTLLLAQLLLLIFRLLLLSFEVLPDCVLYGFFSHQFQVLV